MYTQSYRSWWGKMSIQFLEAIDISENLQRTTQALASVPNGWISLLLAPVALITGVCWASGAYYFDLLSSWEAMTPYRVRIMTVVADLRAVGVLLAWLVQILPFALTLLPTMMELLGSRFARFGIPAVQGAVWFFVLFDIATDAGQVTEFMQTFQGYFYSPAIGWGVLLDPRQLVGWLSYHIAWGLALLAASYFLELLTIIFFWAGIGLLWKSVGFWVFAGAAEEARRPGR